MNLQHHEVLPQGNRLPASYGDIMKLIEPFIMQPIRFVVLMTVLCLGEYIQTWIHAQFVVLHGTQSLESLQGHTYLPVGPRLVRLFGTHKLAKIIQAHGLRCCSDGLVMYDIHDSPSWKLAYSSTGTFSSDCRGISFALNTDGVNPYSQNRVLYSMWPIIELAKTTSMHFWELLVGRYCSW